MTAQWLNMTDSSLQPKIVQALYNFQPANTDEVISWLRNVDL